MEDLVDLVRPSEQPPNMTASEATLPTSDHEGANRRSFVSGGTREVVVLEGDDTQPPELAKLAGGGKPGAPPVSGEGEGHEPQLQDDADGESK